MVIHDKIYAVINEDCKVLGVETSDFLFPPSIEEDWLEESDAELNKAHLDRVYEKYSSLKIFKFRNVILLRENERKTIEEALNEGKEVYLNFHNTAPITLPIEDSYGRVNLTTFYLKEPFNFDIDVRKN